jgi:A118 family predicted phage portal protein
VNSYEPEAPYALPSTALITDQYLSADTIYDLMIREFDLKKPRISVTSKAITEDIDPDGNFVTYFADDEVYQVLNIPGDESEPVKVLDMGEYRTDTAINGLNTVLKIASKLVGFGNDFYGFDPTMQAVTATQVIASKSELFRNLQNERNLMERTIKGTIKALEVLLDIKFGNINVDFDDSIIIDDEKRKEDDVQLLELGMMSRIKFLMIHKGLSKNEAIEWLKEVQEEAELLRDEDEEPQEDEEETSEEDFMERVESGNPYPSEGESQDEFIARCIPELRSEGYSQDQASAICYAKWEK